MPNTTTEPMSSDNHPRYTVDVEIDRVLGMDVDTQWARGVVARALEAENVVEGCAVDIWFTGDEELQFLNRQHRDIDRPTDVLSFAFQETEPFPTVPGEVLSLGQVVISFPRAVAQAREYGHAVKLEAAFLLVHGVLHLLGYNHDGSEEKRRMFERQDVILNCMKLKIPGGR